MPERTDLVAASEALALILEGARPCRSEIVPLAMASGRVLANDLKALRTQPPFNASAMDGYALRAGDVANAPAILRIIGTSAAGHPFSGFVGEGEAVRIFTGGAVPQGADTVVMQENTAAKDGIVTINKAAKTGHSVRPRGLDFALDDVLLRKGDLIDPQRLSLAAAMNHASLPVWQKPHIALAATGDELRMPGSELGEGEIIASNTFGIAAIISASGGTVTDLGIIDDKAQSLDAAFSKALAMGVDAIITTGGASVGDHDLVKPAFERLGAKFAFTKIAMRPGKPLIAGRLDHAGRVVHCIGLAGNPVSSLMATHVFVRPLIAALAGLQAETLYKLPAMLGCPLPANGDREDYMRAHARRTPDGRLEVTPFETQDSSMLALLAKASAILVRPAFAPAAKAGDPCEAIAMRAIPS